MIMSTLFNLKKYFIFSLLVVLYCGATQTLAAVPFGKTLVVYFGQQKAEDFEFKVKPLFMEKAKPCKTCELVNFTPYNKEGVVDMDALFERIESLPAGTSFVYFDFNFKVTEKTKALVVLLNKKAESGLVVVGTAGAPPPDEASGPLSRTMLGQVQGALIIGELAERDRLMPTGFYGPEMLTAVRPPRDLLGQGFAPLIFAAALAENWQKRSGTEWLEYLRTKKMKTRKLWLDLSDMF